MWRQRDVGAYGRALSEQNAYLRRRVLRMEAALKVAAEQFRGYAVHHLGEAGKIDIGSVAIQGSAAELVQATERKGDRLMKAGRNAEMAEMCEGALAYRGE